MNGTSHRSLYEHQKRAVFLRDNAAGIDAGPCLWIGWVPSLAAQSIEEKIDSLARQVTQLNQVILELRSEIAQSRKETQELRLQLSGGEAQSLSGSGGSLDAGQLAVTPDLTLVPQGPTAANATTEERLAEMEEAQQLLSDRLDEQYQTKVESASRYRVKLSGIVMLNAFANRGRVDSQEVPDLSLRPSQTETGRTFGITALQSQVGAGNLRACAGWSKNERRS